LSVSHQGMRPVLKTCSQHSANKLRRILKTTMYACLENFVWSNIT